MSYKIKLPSKAKAKWLAALRDPKRKQITGSLQHVGGQCCLGVACEVIGHGMTISGSTFVSKNGKRGGEPSPVDFFPKTAAALFQNSGDSQPVNVLVLMNDKRGWSFRKIATWIEKNL